MTSRRLGCVCLVIGLLLLPSMGLGGSFRSRVKRSRTHWAFQPVRRPSLPSVHHQAWVRTPVDAFVLAQLEKHGLKPNPQADRRTLLRRVYLDLIGLPPTPAEQETFLRDSSPNAYARVVDELLARPEYGERWARHWLDVVRYAESNGYERDGVKPSAWRYRDYVIHAFNSDKPYDRFLTEQLAGDEMPGATAETKIATTFLRLGTWDDEPADPLVDRCDQLDDVLGTTAAAFLGITLRCARCHDHKFEPFSQVDYYRMVAIFQPLHRPKNDRLDLDLRVGTEAELAFFDKQKQDLEQQKTALHQKLRAHQQMLCRRAGLPPDAMQLGDDLGAVQGSISRLTTQVQGELREAETATEKVQRQHWQQQLAALNARHVPEPPHAYIWTERGSRMPATHVLHRGDPTHPAQEVGPGVPVVLTKGQPAAPRPTAHSSGRRLWLAHWLTRPENPLVARVMVNRIWQHHFGHGIVGSPNDFGLVGEAPTHPHLLDWLAAELVSNGWRIKPLQREIVLSNAYQMSSAYRADAAATDPHNQWLWHWPQWRLEAEAVRDSVLAVSGQLNPAMAGPSMYPTLPQAVLQGQSRPGDGWGHSDERQRDRRSIYIFVKRALAVPELELLDTPDTTSSCEARMISTTAPQALTFLNGAFINEQARHFARRLQREADTDLRARVQRAFMLALCRPPRPDEERAAMLFLKRQRQLIEKEAGSASADAGQRALTALCLVLLNTNEFAYMN